MKPAKLPEDHPFHLTQGEMEYLASLRWAEVALLTEPDQSLESRGLVTVWGEGRLGATRDRMVAITDSGRQALALHEAMQ